MLLVGPIPQDRRCNSTDTTKLSPCSPTTDVIHIEMRSVVVSSQLGGINRLRAFPSSNLLSANSRPNKFCAATRVDGSLIYCPQSGIYTDPVLLPFTHDLPEITSDGSDQRSPECLPQTRSLSELLCPDGFSIGYALRLSEDLQIELGGYSRD